MSDKQRLAGRHIVVTGAGTGIGRAIALRLAAEGAHLTLMARGRERLAETADMIEGDGNAHVETVDVRDRGAVERAFAGARGALGPIAGLVANSGIGGGNEAGPDDRFDDLVSTNLNGTYHCFRAALAHLADGPGARHLIAMSSILGRIGVAGYSGYCASKAGILGLVRSMAVELAPRDIHVNAVCPGWVDTEMAREGIRGIASGLGLGYDEAWELAMSQVPMHRMSEPEDIAGLVAWLLTDDARGVTGQALDMNGGAFMI